jgi:hypothetical protein
MLPPVYFRQGRRRPALMIDKIWKVILCFQNFKLVQIITGIGMMVDCDDCGLVTAPSSRTILGCSHLARW